MLSLIFAWKWHNLVTSLNWTLQLMMKQHENVLQDVTMDVSCGEVTVKYVVIWLDSLVIRTFLLSQGEILYYYCTYSMQNTLIITTNAQSQLISASVKQKYPLAVFMLKQSRITTKTKLQSRCKEFDGYNFLQTRTKV